MIKIIKWERVQHQKIIGKATIEVERIVDDKFLAGFFIEGCTYWSTNDKKFVTLPSRTVEEDGKKKYVATMGFTNPDLNKKFCEAIKLAIDNYLLNEGDA